MPCSTTEADQAEPPTPHRQRKRFSSDWHYSSSSDLLFCTLARARAGPGSYTSTVGTSLPCWLVGEGVGAGPLPDESARPSSGSPAPAARQCRELFSGLTTRCPGHAGYGCVAAGRHSRHCSPRPLACVHVRLDSTPCLQFAGEGEDCELNGTRLEPAGRSRAQNRPTGQATMRWSPPGTLLAEAPGSCSSCVCPMAAPSQPQGLR